MSVPLGAGLVPRKSAEAHILEEDDDVVVPRQLWWPQSLQLQVSVAQTPLNQSILLGARQVLMRVQGEHKG